MTSEPLVSCIIIFLNGEPYLGEAIESIFAQTYSNWELLLVDDGSSDGSTQIAQRYAQAHPERVRYLEHAGHQNRGMSATRNLGIRQARGAYVAFLDADDVWLPHKLAQQVAILNRQPRAGMVYGRTLIWHSWTGRPEDRERDHFLDLGVPPDTLVEPPTLFLRLLENKTQTPTTCNVLIRGSVFTQVGGFEEHFRGMYEDQAFFAKLHLHYPVYVAGECWARYRQHPASCSALSEQLSDYHATRLPLLCWLADYLTRAGFARDSTAGRAVQRELWLCRHPRWRRLIELPRYLAWRMKLVMSSALARHEPTATG